MYEASPSQQYYAQPVADWSSSTSDQEIMHELRNLNTNINEPASPVQQIYEQSSSSEFNAAAAPMQQPSRFQKRSSGSGGGGGSNRACATAAAPLADLIINSKTPIELKEIEKVTVLGQTGLLANKSDMRGFHGQLPLCDYPINDDPNPEVLHKRSDQQICYNQEIAIRYLRPPTPPKPGDIHIKQERDCMTMPAPPIVIRQQPEKPPAACTLVIREKPPTPPEPVPAKTIVVPGKQLPPPPRRVIIERLPQLPPKPQNVLIERWLPYKEQRRRVIFTREESDACAEPKQRNLIIQWDAPKVCVKKVFKDLGVVNADPFEYVSKYGASLKSASELPDFVREFKPPTGLMLHTGSAQNEVCALEGDVKYLSMIDLDREGLGAYKKFVNNNQANFAREC